MSSAGIDPRLLRFYNDELAYLREEARAFADFLASARQRLWQMLPVGPVGYGDSPYSSTSAFAGNPLFYEYFHGDDGHGLGASHQTGWTALAAILLGRARKGFRIVRVVLIKTTNSIKMIGKIAE